MYECRSLIGGEWPPCNFKKTGEGFLSRIAYTWVGVFWLSIVFYFGMVYGLQVRTLTRRLDDHICFLYINTHLRFCFDSLFKFVGYFGPSMMSPFVGATDHIYFMRPITWIVTLFIPVAVMVSQQGIVRVSLVTECFTSFTIITQGLTNNNFLSM